MCFVLQLYSQAERFYQVLGKRLSKYGLELHGDKSRLLPSGTRAAARAHEAVPGFRPTNSWDSLANGDLQTAANFGALKLRVEVIGNARNSSDYKSSYKKTAKPRTPHS